ncbi:Smr domain-containing protein [Thermosyntropha lipolytica DSM 11003]|uniref:Smr domain-containing protein n=1 Tax=Thermosyntropha lipolytica DSM 11003 TaxID=1123382 RepID=A0A1M5M481_9FIRM|nr:Smr/MutS family protein [Thermosyntropha lipolytica]SHG72036.1 Smr domain-containing protein [Thermosyntropha lipolytica DSM 11003]
MRVEKVDLHGLSLAEALEKVEKNLNWCIKHGVAVIDIVHGKGYHSSRNFSVIKKEVRKSLKENELIKNSGYTVIYGESDLPIALTFDEGHTLIVARGLENEYIGGRKQIEKNLAIYSKEGKKQRKMAKEINAQRKNSRKPR